MIHYSVKSITGKCTINHTHDIPNLETYKRQDDAFYYNQLYDRYAQRVYDVIPISQALSLPFHVRSKLARQYAFLVVETERSASVKADLKKCTTCCGVIPLEKVIEYVSFIVYRYGFYFLIWGSNGALVLSDLDVRRVIVSFILCVLDWRKSHDKRVMHGNASCALRTTMKWMLRV